ncbi:nucleotidyltransferase family protein [Piscinibacter terrae]|uniref:CBS domain-containing protein n=1 Tax=Piscinibacter terrae TaxID=2496871 RepID=A0A3N7IRX5_9BURK|nr:nucleotidyltransferase family protein [Albitalea terrae]RQP21622.1 CBS domain-containing protein [Albitalea terrae]
MKLWEQVLVGPQTSLRDALAVIDRTGSHMALVVDADRRLMGTLSDGDIRRALLRGIELVDSVTRAMHKTPVCARTTDDTTAILSTMRRRGLHQMPVLDPRGRVVGLQTYVDFFDTPRRTNWVVIMAGGLGTRLGELTRDTPKPMLQVGSRPLLETIVRHIAGQGFERIYLAVNYKAEQIEAHFGDGSAMGLDIRYLRENQRMGTAGALSLLPEVPTDPIIVTNADLLTKEDFGHMVDRHVELGADATMAVRPYEMQVPFGVVRESDGRIEAIEEKPMQRFVVNAGIYVLSPQSLQLVPRDCFFDMPSLFEALALRGMHARCHHINGYWMDIGRLSDYERANTEFNEVFR